MNGFITTAFNNNFAVLFQFLVFYFCLLRSIQFDENLQKGHDLYKGYRVAHTISPARVHVVRPGTFKELRDYIVSRTTASVNQFKTPRKLKTKEQMEWMMERVTEVE